jgi:hypothetical protein
VVILKHCREKNLLLQRIFLVYSTKRGCKQLEQKSFCSTSGLEDQCRGICWDLLVEIDNLHDNKFSRSFFLFVFQIDLFNCLNEDEFLIILNMVTALALSRVQDQAKPALTVRGSRFGNGGAKVR